MQVITQEFRQSVKAQLNSLQAGFYLTREQLCVGAGVDPVYATVISIIMQETEFLEAFEGIKSRGYRKRKVSLAA